MKNGESNSENKNINPVQLAPRLPNAMIKMTTVDMIDPVIKNGFIQVELQSLNRKTDQQIIIFQYIFQIACPF